MRPTTISNRRTEIVNTCNSYIHCRRCSRSNHTNKAQGTASSKTNHSQGCFPPKKTITWTMTDVTSGAPEAHENLNPRFVRSFLAAWMSCGYKQITQQVKTCGLRQKGGGTVRAGGGGGKPPTPQRFFPIGFGGSRSVQI